VCSVRRNRLPDIAVLGSILRRFCADFERLRPLGPAPGVCGWTIELPNFFKML
jgi:hypothetical protein